MKKIYIIPHTHWDREWYKTFQENRVRLIKFMDDLFDTIDNDKRYKCFILDGQTSLILDYIEVKPQNKQKLKDLIRAERIIIGPWFVQPDENLPSGESLIRNLLISKKISDEYGNSMKVGYLPDSFGQSAVMPTILKGFGIESAMFYRGIAEEDTPYNEFLWHGLDGSEVMAVWLPIGYGNGMFLSEDLEKSIQEVERNISLLESRSVNGNILLMCGSDQCFSKKFLPAICEKLQQYYLEQGKDYEFLISSIDKYMEELSLSRDKMSVLTGEFRKGKHSRTHISIGGTRLDIKMNNFYIEQKYQKLLEPLTALIYLFDDEYENDIINRGWRYIIENHAHDSICTCCTDMVHSEMKMRIAYANQIADTIIKDKFSRLNSLINYNHQMGRPVILFSSFLGTRRDLVNVDVYVKDTNFVICDNTGQEIDYFVNDISTFNLKDTKVAFMPLPDDYYHKVNIDFYADIEGLGYKTYYIKEGRQKSKTEKGLVNDNILENEFVKAEVLKNGTIKITDKINGIVYDNMHVLMDSGNAGDEYDYSPPYNDTVITSIGSLHSANVLSDTPLKASLQLQYSMLIPKTTYAQERSAENTVLEVTTIMSITRYDPRIDFKTIINNTAENHRLQVVFDFGKTTKVHFADIQLGEIERENELELTAESEQKNWSERYYPIYNQHKYCGISDYEGVGFIIMNKGLPQYEIDNSESTKICITLLSSVGYMGNENLKYRKGRRSGALCTTPDSQMMGILETEYSFMPVNNSIDYFSLAERYINPIYAVSYAEYEHDGILPDNMTLIRNGDGLLLSAFKYAEDETGCIIRFLNPQPCSKNSVNIYFNKHLFKNIESVNLAESPITDTNVKIIKENNPDGSDKARFSGIVMINHVNRNALITQKIYK